MSGITTTVAALTRPGSQSQPSSGASSRYSDGALFIRRLADDAAIGPNDPATMEQLFERLFPRDDDGNIVFNEDTRRQVADELIQSLGQLDRNRAENARAAVAAEAVPAASRTPEQREAIAAEEAWTRATGNLRHIIEDPSLTSPGQIADAIESHHEQELRKPADQRADFWTLFGQSGSDFAVTLNEADLERLRYALNAIAPGLGDTLVGFMEVWIGTDDGLTNNERAVSNQLEAGFAAMTGGQLDLARFWGRDHATRMVNGQEENVPFNVWNPPGNPEQRAAFFSDAGMEDRFGDTGTPYKIYDTDAAGMTRNFESMILARWEEQDVLSFDNDAARDQFIQFSHQLMQGGVLGQAYLNTLNERIEQDYGSGLIFDGNAQAEFVEFLETLDTRFVSPNPDISREQYIAQEIAAYIDEHGGIHMPDGMGEAQLEYLAQESAQYFTPVAGPREYASLVMEYAARPNSGMNIDIGRDTPYTGISAAAGVSSGGTPPIASPPATAPVAAAPDLSGVTDMSDPVTVQLDDSGVATATIGGASVTAFSLADEFDLYKLDVVDANGDGVGEIVHNIEESDLSIADLKARLGGDEITLEEVTHHGTDTVIGYRFEAGGEEYFLGFDALESRDAAFNDANKVSRDADATQPGNEAAQDQTYQLPGNTP